MARWRPRISPEVEAELRAMGPYTIRHSGHLVWDAAPGFDWPWGDAGLSFHVDHRGAGDADFRRLIDAWRQVRERQGEVVTLLRAAIERGWGWACESSPAGRLAEDLGEQDGGDPAAPFRHVGGCGFSLGTFGAGQVSLAAVVEVDWDHEHGLQVDLIEQDRRASWSFL